MTKICIVELQGVNEVLKSLGQNLDHKFTEKK